MLLGSWGNAEAASPLRERVLGFVRERETALLQEYIALLSLPNLASDDAGIRKNAAAIARMLEARGVATRLLDGEGGPPVVYGELSVGAPKTVVIYAHYDGQPVEPERWASPPWTPVLRDGPLEPGARTLDLAALKGPLDPEWRIFARSASDDKAPILAISCGARRAQGARREAVRQPQAVLRGRGGGRVAAHRRGAGEEPRAAARRRLAALRRAGAPEPASPGRVRRARRDRRRDHALRTRARDPQRSLRQLGPEPGAGLAQLVAGLRDADGRITIAGFYDDVRPITPAERTALAAVPDVDAAMRSELSLAATEAAGARLVERLMLPALNLRGLASGAVGAKAQNAIPVDARASIDFRLVPDQTPEKVRERFEAHLRAQGWNVIHAEPTLEERRATAKLVRLEWGPGYPAGRTRLDLPFSRRLLAVVSEGLPEPVIALPTLGGSIPMQVFIETFGVPVVLLPIANHDNSQHAPDENLRLRNLWDGIATFAVVLSDLGGAW